MSQLPNYLLSNRKRLALSQEEVAFILGNKGGAKVSRYEHFACEPNLETALALEVIFQRSVSELFGGLYQKVQQEVAMRANTLSNKTEGRQTSRKRQILINIANKTLN